MAPAHSPPDSPLVCPSLPPSEQVFAEYEAAAAAIEGLSKRVNKKVQQMFERAEEEYR